MSKAFMKDDVPESASDNVLDDSVIDDLEVDQEANDDLDSEEAAKFSALTGGKNYITQKGFLRLKAEVHELLNVERPKVVEVVAWAASNGDRSENADYTYGKKRLREIDRKLRFLQKRLDRAVVVHPETQSGDRVLFGATVTVEDENGSPKVFKIVGIDETDAKTGKISWISPIGKSLLQARVGDFVELHTPKGEEELEVKKIEFLPID